MREKKEIEVKGLAIPAMILGIYLMLAAHIIDVNINVNVDQCKQEASK